MSYNLYKASFSLKLNLEECSEKVKPADNFWIFSGDKSLKSGLYFGANFIFGIYK